MKFLPTGRRNGRSRKRGFGFATSVMQNPWQDSTHAEVAWTRKRQASGRWAWAGVALGLLLGLIFFAPAEWAARAVASATQDRIRLVDARGTVWSGSAVLVLTGGAGSRDATALPGRVDWTVGLQGRSLAVRARQDCCLNGTVTLLVQPGFGRFSVTLPAQGNWIAQWPSALLSGLGTPWNTLQLGGNLRIASPGFTVHWVQGRAIFHGRADIEFEQTSSRLSTLRSLGSYRFSITGDAARPAEPAQLTLITMDAAALRLTGSGTLTPQGVRFRGEAMAAPEQAAALSNLLNIIGRRDGVRSAISIG